MIARRLPLSETRGSRRLMDRSLVGLYREAFRDLPLHSFLGLRIRRLRDPVVVELGLSDAVRGLGLRLHGGVIATLVDVTSAIAAFRSARWAPNGTVLRTAELQVRYLAQPAGDKVTATAVVVGFTDDKVTVECAVEDGEGKLVATANLTLGIVRSVDRHALPQGTRGEAAP